MSGGNGGESAGVTLTIDGREVTVAPGTTILDAAALVGTKVPHYCYHPGLTSPAQCRLCLVEVEGAPKPMPSCVTEVREGAVVHTESARAKELRRGVLEFYLVNHPLDCPICDQAGECKLQDYVNAEGRMRGRSREPKRVFGRDDFGGDILFYGDRCVMCTRCVRFMNEVAQDERLTVVERGNRAVIDTFFDHGVEGSPYAGNIVDICPVGALVSKDFLHKARAWDLDHTPSVCPSCSQGCNIDLHTRDNLVQRLKPRENHDVNAYWMCDYGRHNYEWINRTDRLDAPMVRDDGMLRPAGWNEALTALLERLSDAPGPALVIATGRECNEDLGAVAALVGQLGGGELRYRSARTDTEEPLPGFPKLVRREDLSPNATGAELLGFERIGGDDAQGGLEAAAAHTGTLIVLGDELVDADLGFGERAELFVHLARHSTDAQMNADFVLPITTFAEQEGTFTNHEGRVQRFWQGLLPPGSARPAWLVLGALLAELTGSTVPRTAEEAFAGLGDLADPFSGITYRDLGTRGAIVNEPVGLGA